MIFKESDFLLNNSRETIDVINDFYKKSLQEKEISIVLQLKIKHFLEDIKSALDYAAFMVYKTYSESHIKDKPEDHERSVCFPVKHTEKKFDTFIKNTFPCLKENKPQIIEIFKKPQPFNKNADWYTTFNSLVNKNKHRYLTPQTKNEVTMIKTFDQKGKVLSQFNHGGIVITNSTNVTVDGMDWDQERQLPIPSSNRGYLSETWVSFIFKELNMPVIPILREIQEETEIIVSHLEAIMKNEQKKD